MKILNRVLIEKILDFLHQDKCYHIALYLNKIKSHLP